jgi:hypothetical protein
LLWLRRDKPTTFSRRDEIGEPRPANCRRKVG